MAKEAPRGSLAYKIFSIVDPDISQDPDNHHKQLDAIATEERNAVESSVKAFTGKIRRKRDAVQDHVDRKETARQEFATAHADHNELSRLWRKRKVQQKLHIVHMGPIAKWMLLVVVLVIDIGVFVDAWTTAFDNPGFMAYMVGALIGITVFATSIWVAQYLKRFPYKKAQEKLKEELRKEAELSPSELNELRVSDTEEMGLFFAAVIFLAAIGGGIYMRLSDGQVADVGAGLIFFALPFLGFVLEYLTNDPSEERCRKKDLLDWFLNLHKSRLNRKLEVREEVTASRLDSVEQKYAFERATLNSIHDLHGFRQRTEHRVD